MMPRVVPFLALLAAAAGLCVAKAPHLRLAARLASGDLDGRTILVVDSSLQGFHEDTVELACGALRFAVPVGATVTPCTPGESQGIMVDVAGVKGTVLAPSDADEDDSDLPAAPPTMFEGVGINGLASICGASARDLRFWMSASAVDELEQRLQMRRLLCVSAERVDVVRGHDLAGLLLSWRGTGCVCVVFEYHSLDNRVRGQAVWVAAGDGARALETAQSFVSTFRLVPAPHTGRPLS